MAPGKDVRRRVYLVWAGEWDDVCLEGVFGGRKAAEAYAHDLRRIPSHQYRSVWVRELFMGWMSTNVDEAIATEKSCLEAHISLGLFVDPDIGTHWIEPEMIQKMRENVSSPDPEADRE